MCRFTIHVAGPDNEEFAIEEEVLKECEVLSQRYGGRVVTSHDAAAAVRVSVYDISSMYTHIHSCM